MKNVVREFLNLLFPPVCLICDRALVQTETYLCSNCQASLPRVHQQSERSRQLYKRIASTLPLDEVLAYLLYQKSGSTQKLLQLLKYKNYPELGIEIGRHFGTSLAKAGYTNAFDLIVPVPLHKSKLEQRGYNQSEMFANGLSEALGIPTVPEVVVRVKESATQTRKSRLERWLNVATIFQVVQQERVKGKRILLTDDVVTTGATLEACGEALIIAGCANLSVGVIAIA